VDLIKKKPPERGPVSPSGNAKNDTKSSINNSGGSNSIKLQGSSSGIVDQYKVGEKQSTNVRDLTIRAADVTNDPEYQKLLSAAGIVVGKKENDKK